MQAQLTTRRHHEESSVATATGASGALLLLLATEGLVDQRALLEAASQLLEGPTYHPQIQMLLGAGHVVRRGSDLTILDEYTRSAILDAAAPAQLAAAHRAWGMVLVEDPLKQAWHRAHSSAIPDSRAAREAGAAATTLQRAGRHEDSVALFRQAARLAEDLEERAELLGRGSAAAYGAGMLALGRELSAHVRAWQLGGDLPVTMAVLDAAFRRAHEQAPATWDDHVRAARTLTRWGQPAAAFVVLAAAPSGAWSGRDVGAELVAPDDSRQSSALEGLALMRGGSLTAALCVLQDAASDLEDRGVPGAAVAAYACLAETASCLGQVTTAAQALERATVLGRRLGLARWETRLALSDALLSSREGRGREPSTVATVQRALLDADRLLRARAELVQGVDLISRERWDEAFDLLAPLVRHLRRSDRELVAWGLLSHFADAASHGGHVDEARSVLSELSGVEGLFEYDVELAELLYATAVLAQARLRRRLLRGTALSRPDALAVAQGAGSSGLRRAPPTCALCVELTQTPELGSPSLCRDGSSHWHDRAGHELRAAGVRDATAAISSLPLSPQELEIVRMATRGLSNREIGQALFLSPRTIGSHLYRIFPKLNITSRNQLSNVLAGDCGAQSTNRSSRVYRGTTLERSDRAHP